MMHYYNSATCESDIGGNVNLLSYSPSSSFFAPVREDVVEIGNGGNGRSRNMQNVEVEGGGRVNANSETNAYFNGTNMHGDASLNNSFNAFCAYDNLNNMVTDCSNANNSCNNDKVCEGFYNINNNYLADISEYKKNVMNNNCNNNNNDIYNIINAADEGYNNNNSIINMHMIKENDVLFSMGVSPSIQHVHQQLNNSNRNINNANNNDLSNNSNNNNNTLSSSSSSWSSEQENIILPDCDSLNTKDDQNQVQDFALNDISLEYPYHSLLDATNYFNVSNRLGQGAYGSVFKGTLKEGTEVAIKVLHLPKEAGFEEEVQVLSKFRHPNLVILMGFGRHGSSRMLVYEMLSGGDVGTRLLKGPWLSWHERISIALDSACGLSHLHNSSPRVFHRDIKSANILLDRNGSAKMADFGLACLMKNGDEKCKVKQTAGTIGYADPQYITSAVVDEKTEVYSFGMVLLELLTARPPAVQNGDGSVTYLISYVGNSLANVLSLVDFKANFPQHFSQRIAKLALSCIQECDELRPDFKMIVKQLRLLLNHANACLAHMSLSLTTISLSPVHQHHHSQHFCNNNNNNNSVGGVMGGVYTSSCESEVGVRKRGGDACMGAPSENVHFEQQQIIPHLLNGSNNKHAQYAYNNNQGVNYCCVSPSASPSSIPVNRNRNNSYNNNNNFNAYILSPPVSPPSNKNNNVALIGGVDESIWNNIHLNNNNNNAYITNLSSLIAASPTLPRKFANVGNDFSQGVYISSACPSPVSIKYLEEKKEKTKCLFSAAVSPLPPPALSASPGNIYVFNERRNNNNDILNFNTQKENGGINFLSTQTSRRELHDCVNFSNCNNNMIDFSNNEIYMNSSNSNKNNMTINFNDNNINNNVYKQFMHPSANNEMFHSYNNGSNNSNIAYSSPSCLSCSSTSVSSSFTNNNNHNSVSMQSSCRSFVSCSSISNSNMPTGISSILHNNSNNNNNNNAGAYYYCNNSNSNSNSFVSFLPSSKSTLTSSSPASSSSFSTYTSEEYSFLNNKEKNRNKSLIISSSSSHSESSSHFHSNLNTVYRNNIGNNYHNYNRESVIVNETSLPSFLQSSVTEKATNICNNYFKNGDDNSNIMLHNLSSSDEYIHSYVCSGSVEDKNVNNNSNNKNVFSVSFSPPSPSLTSCKNALPYPIDSFINNININKIKTSDKNTENINVNMFDDLRYFAETGTVVGEIGQEKRRNLILMKEGNRNEILENTMNKSIALEEDRKMFSSCTSFSASHSSLQSLSSSTCMYQKKKIHSNDNCFSASSALFAPSPSSVNFSSSYIVNENEYNNNRVCKNSNAFTNFYNNGIYENQTKPEKLKRNKDNITTELVEDELKYIPIDTGVRDVVVRDLNNIQYSISPELCTASPFSSAFSPSACSSPFSHPLSSSLIKNDFNSCDRCDANSSSNNNTDNIIYDNNNNMSNSDELIVNEDKNYSRFVMSNEYTLGNLNFSLPYSNAAQLTFSQSSPLVSPTHAFSPSATQKGRNKEGIIVRKRVGECDVIAENNESNNNKDNENCTSIAGNINIVHNSTFISNEVNNNMCEYNNNNLFYNVKAPTNTCMYSSLASSIKKGEIDLIKNNTFTNKNFCKDNFFYHKEQKIISKGEHSFSNNKINNNNKRVDKNINNDYINEEYILPNSNNIDKNSVSIISSNNNTSLYNNYSNLLRNKKNKVYNNNEIDTSNNMNTSISHKLPVCSSFSPFSPLTTNCNKNDTKIANAATLLALVQESKQNKIYSSFESQNHSNYNNYEKNVYNDNYMRDKEVSYNKIVNFLANNVKVKIKSNNKNK